VVCQGKIWEIKEILFENPNGFFFFLNVLFPDSINYLVFIQQYFVV